MEINFDKLKNMSSAEIGTIIDTLDREIDTLQKSQMIVETEELELSKQCLIKIVSALVTSPFHVA